MKSFDRFLHRWGLEAITLTVVWLVLNYQTITVEGLLKIVIISIVWLVLFISNCWDRACRTGMIPQDPDDDRI